MTGITDNIQKLINGLFIPAMPLALDDDRKFDERVQRRILRHYVSCGAGGIAAAVHTTQFEIRDPRIGLHERVLSVTADELSAHGGIVKIAGVCGKTEQAVREAELSAEYGYDAVLLSPGGLKALSEAELIYRSEKVAEVLPVVGFYLQEAVGGRYLSFDFWKKFCEIENVYAIKCAAFNRYATIDTMRAAALSRRAGKIGMYTGNDDNIGADLLTTYRFTYDGAVYEKRFTGGLLGHWAVWTKTAVRLYEKFRTAADKGEIAPDLLTAAAAVTDMNSAVFDTAHNYKGCIAGVHEVLRREGVMENILCLDPDETLSEGQAEEIDRVYAAYPDLI